MAPADTVQTLPKLRCRRQARRKQGPPRWKKALCRERRSGGKLSACRPPHAEPTTGAEARSLLWLVQTQSKRPARTQDRPPRRNIQCLGRLAVMRI